MGEGELVEPDEEKGLKVLKHLDRERVAVDAAFWFKHDDDEWKFYLHTPILEAKSRTQAYKAIQKALLGINNYVSIQDLSLIREDDPLLRTMKQLISTDGKGTAVIRLSRNTVNGVLFGTRWYTVSSAILVS
ncbi:hypothetical protein [Arthrobacter polaris]|uniref:hypothetical protein n=1 Tax=Arthrobacter polaris TaxID=2813727 RepID=UPI001F3D5925|nr:hypothetical protein [Arthrobacter polaris]UIK90273.1 hypothetical protein J0916_08435 [Arthrobacter polaris]